jgi:hypothetical protein
MAVWKTASDTSMICQSSMPKISSGPGDFPNFGAVIPFDVYLTGVPFCDNYPMYHLRV